MANPTASNVLVAKPLATGGVLHAPLGTALPTTAIATPNVAFIGLGYIGEDGVTRTIGADTTDVIAWGGDLVRRIQTTHTVEFAWSFLELNGETAKAVYGADQVTVGAGTLAVELTSDERDHEAWILEIKDGDKKVRIAIPDGQVTEVGDVVYTHTDAALQPVTLTCYPDSSGVKAYMYVDDDGAIAIPVITSVLPSGETTGELVEIVGSDFTGATAVTFGGTPATDFVVNSASLITAVLPAGSAGPVDVLVTTPVGVSAAYSYTRA